MYQVRIHGRDDQGVVTAAELLLPTSLAARAHEENVCYRLPIEVLIPLLCGREGLRFVARSLLARRSRTATWDGTASADPARRSVAAFIREPVVTCDPSATVREVAQDMAARGASCALVHLRDTGSASSPTMTFASA
jgi:CBS domain-containing protein